MSPTRVGNYELVERIGEGGMGEVWLARHRNLRRLFAVKLIRPETLSSGSADDARRRFEREAHATSALRSPHTVAIFDYGRTDAGDVYYGMELLEGISLATLVAEFGPVPPERAVHLLGGVCESLGEAHERGLVHRDVKPANVFTCMLGGKYDFVKVLDFGLVKAIPAIDASASPTITGNIAGSPAFLAPEAARGVIAPSGDIYGLGCVAYWLLTGKLVFEGPTALDIMLAHAQREPVPPSVRAGLALPPELDRLVLACLEKDPARRPKSVTDVAEQLEACPLQERWTTARARSFFEEHRDAIERANPAMLRVHELAHRVDLEGGPAPVGVAGGEVRQERVQASLDRLQHHFTKSHIDIHELELRMLRVKKAKSADEIDKVLADLPSLEAPGRAPPTVAYRSEPPGDGAPGLADVMAARAVITSGPQQQRMRAIGPDRALALRAPSQALAAPVISVLSSTRRGFAVQDGEIYRAVAVMGEATIIIDGSELSEGTAELRCVAVMGNITVYVQPGIDVEAEGIGVLGVFEHWGGPRQSQGPRLRVTGVAVLGMVTVLAGRR